MLCILTMNGADEVLMNVGHSHALGLTGDTYGFAVSSIIGPSVFGGMDVGSLELLERIGWWGHIIMVFTFLNYWTLKSREITAS